MEIVALATGAIIGLFIALVIVVPVMNMFRTPIMRFVKSLRSQPPRLPTAALVAALMVAVTLVAPHATFAQTPVPLVIPTNTIFTETNTWIATFAPIAAIGIGITVALAVLGYIGNIIKGAFK